MKVRIDVIHSYFIETEGGDTTDAPSINAHCREVESMTPEQIQRDGSYIGSAVGSAEVVGPDDPE